MLARVSVSVKQSDFLLSKADNQESRCFRFQGNGMACLLHFTDLGKGCLFVLSMRIKPRSAIMLREGETLNNKLSNAVDQLYRQ